MKLTSPIALLRRFAGTGWCAKGQTLHIMALALVYAPVDIVPVCCRSIHTRLIDKCLNDAMRIVTGCLRPTPTKFLPLLSGIQPAELCRTGATISLSLRALNQPKHLLHRLVSDSSPGHQWLKSRCTFVPAALDLLKKTMQEDQFSTAQWMTEKWRSKWESMTTPLHLHFPTPQHQQRPTGLDLPRLACTQHTSIICTQGWEDSTCPCTNGDHRPVRPVSVAWRN